MGTVVINSEHIAIYLYIHSDKKTVYLLAYVFSYLLVC